MFASWEMPVKIGLSDCSCSLTALLDIYDRWKSAGYLDLQGEKSRPDKSIVFRAFACIIDYMYFFDENTTVNGTVSIFDAAHYSMKLHGYISLEERRDFIQTWQV